MVAPDITMVDMDARVAWLDNGERIKVTNMFDGQVETDLPCRADRFVAGPDAAGNWYAAMVAPETMQ